MLLLVQVILALWVSCAHGQGRTCDFPEIKHGNIYEENRYKPTFPVATGKYFYYSCDHSFVSPSGSLWTQINCTEGGWSPAPRCIRQCFFPWVENGHSSSSGRTHQEGDSVQIVCDKGHRLANNQDVIVCTEDGWSSPPTCSRIRNTCPRPPSFDNAILLGQPKNSYKSGAQVSYICSGYYQMEGSGTVQCKEGIWIGTPTCKDFSCGSPPPVLNAYVPDEKLRYRHGETAHYQCRHLLDLFGNEVVTCLRGNWTDPPECKDSSGKCGRPPTIDNGDITSYPSAVYAPGSSVEYQCQAYYVLAGNRRITCHNGEWSEPPKCLDACVISEEVLEEHKIEFKWSYDKKLYSETNDFTEFRCRRGFYPKSPRSAFRVQCREGKMEFPTCW